MNQFARSHKELAFVEINFDEAVDAKLFSIQRYVK